MIKIPASDKITILSLSWRDLHSKKAGGAEIHTHTILSRANKDKYRVYHIAMEDSKPLSGPSGHLSLERGEAPYIGSPGRDEAAVIDGVTYIRHGGVLGVIFYAWRFYLANRKNIDYVLDQCNTHRFFTGLWVKKEKRIFYIHQLTREIWDIHLGFPLNKIGKALETSFLKLQKKDHAITVSQSTKDDLVSVGFKPERVHIVPNYLTTKPWEPSEFDEKKPAQFVYVGRYAKYKGIDVSIEALAEVKKKYPQATLVVVGKKDEEYIAESLVPLCKQCGLSISDADKSADVYLTGFVTDEEKLHYQSESQCLLFPSIREGWGLIITEAAVVGTPSIVYDAPGSRDAVDRGRAGYLTKENTVAGLAEMMLYTLDNPDEYQKMRQAAYDFSTNYLKWGVTTDVIDELITDIRG